MFDCDHCAHSETAPRNCKGCTAGPDHGSKWTPIVQAGVSANERQVGGDHYKRNAVQPWDYIAANGLGYFEGNVVKYVSRWRDKGGVADLEKAQHYLAKLIELAQGE